MIDVACVLDVCAPRGECPVWCAGEGVLYWADLNGRTINRFGPASSARTAT